MNTIPLRENVTVTTSNGPIIGRVVGTEQRDPTRHGNDELIPYVCVRVDDTGDWAWFPASDVEVDNCRLTRKGG